MSETAREAIRYEMLAALDLSSNAVPSAGESAPIDELQLRASATEVRDADRE